MKPSKKYQFKNYHPCTSQESKHMLERQESNRVNCLKSKAEAWFNEKLKETNLKWTRQAIWGYRLFDFWNHKIGVAIEVDGKEHNKWVDKLKDNYNFKRSGIIVLRVDNFNEEHATEALEAIKKMDLWVVRRERMGLFTKAEKKWFNREKSPQLSLGI